MPVAGENEATAEAGEEIDDATAMLERNVKIRVVESVLDAILDKVGDAKLVALVGLVDVAKEERMVTEENDVARGNGGGARELLLEPDELAGGERVVVGIEIEEIAIGSDAKDAAMSECKIVVAEIGGVARDRGVGGAIADVVVAADADKRNVVAQLSENAFEVGDLAIAHRRIDRGREVDEAVGEVAAHDGECGREPIDVVHGTLRQCDVVEPRLVVIHEAKLRVGQLNEQKRIADALATRTRFQANEITRLRSQESIRRRCRCRFIVIIIVVVTCHR